MGGIFLHVENASGRNVVTPVEAVFLAFFSVNFNSFAFPGASLRLGQRVTSHHYHLKVNYIFI